MGVINIILVTYNRPKFLKKAISSILAQTFEKFNLIILNNGSEIETDEVIKSFKDRRITNIKNNINSKEFINSAFRYLDCEYFMITHDDDEMAPSFLDHQINILRLKDEIDLLSSRINLIDENSDNLKKVRPRLFRDKIWRKGEYINEYFFSGNIIPCPTIIFRSNFLKNNPLKYNWDAGPAADLYLLFEANLKGTLALSKEPVFNYRIHDNQDSELNRISLEFMVKSEIINLLNLNNLDNLIDKYNSASNGIILNILFEGLLTKIISLSIFKKNIISLLNNHNLKIDRYTLYWSIIGLFRGIKNLIKI